MKLSIKCCAFFSQMMDSFDWYSYETNGKLVLVMPCIKDEKTSQTIRINFCPSCGENVRGIEVRKT